MGKSIWELLGLWSPPKRKRPIPKRRPITRCRPKSPPAEIHVHVDRLDTDESVDGVTVHLTGGRAIDLRATSGDSRTGTAVFEETGQGSFEAQVELTQEQRRLFFQAPKLRDIRNGPGKKHCYLHLRPIPKLELTEVSDHFAPSHDRARIEYTIQGLVGEVVEIEITSPHYANNPLYTRALTEDEKRDGEHVLEWDGKVNGDGPLAGRYVNPLCSPYVVKLRCDQVRGAEQVTKDVRVLYHSLEIVDGSYTADGQCPPKDQSTVAWAQYRLNELGYFAGPVDGTRGSQTKRALRRYTAARPGTYDGHRVLDNEGNPTLQQHLTEGRGARRILENDHFPTAGTTGKGYIDHDLFFDDSNGDWQDATGHVDKDEDHLDRVEVPLEAVVRLVARDDDYGDGVVAPEGTGEVRIEWVVVDTAQDTAPLPVSTVDVPSHGQAYVDAALVATRENAGAAGNDNCLHTNARGGQRQDPHRSTRYIRDGTALPPFDCTHHNHRVYTTVHQDRTACADKLGRAGVLFRGSWIAGDSYRVEAKLDLQHHTATNAQIVNVHTTLAQGEGNVLADVTDSTTGTLVIWRRHHVAAIIDWPDPGRRPDFAAIQAQYALAHCELIDRSTTYTAAQLFPTVLEQQAYVNAVTVPLGGAYVQWGFNADAILPLQYAPHTHAFFVGNALDVDTYKQMADGLVQNVFNAIGDRLGRHLRERIDAVHEPGLIIVRGDPLPALTVTRSSRVTVFGYHVYTQQVTTQEPVNGVCVGLGSGVAVIDNQLSRQEQDSFLYAHEMAHCRYLHHHEGPGGKPTNHDTTDHNCTMSYPDKIVSRQPLTWNRGDATESRFCGKCLLKLRGWDVTDVTLPGHH